ncbi:MAG: exosortase F system-associated protein [Cyclobacteriaceae bacterium]
MKSANLKPLPELWIRATLFLTGIAILGLVYLFQRINLAVLLGDFHPNVIFVINRTTRLILNDLACFLIIFALFRENKYLKIAFWVFLFELLVILPVYLVVKLSLEGDSEISSPLLSQVHRLIVNPMLMILLMAGFIYQRILKK